MRPFENPPRLVAWACFLLFAVLALNVFLRSRLPVATIEGWATDHAAHTGSTILLAHEGFDIYHRPIRELCPQAADASRWSQQWGLLDEHVCRVPGREAERPLIINWRQYPRSYPPGANLLAVPEALLYAHTGAPFHAINQLTVCKYIAAALVAFFLFFLLVHERLAQEPVLWLALALVLSQTLQSSLGGFYDSAALACIFASVLCLERDKNAWAAAACAGALFLHYRAVWYAPLGAYALWRHVRGRPWQESLRRRQWVPLLLAAVLCALPVFTFLMALPAVSAYPANNPLRGDGRSPLGPWDLALVGGLCLLWLVRARAWLALSVSAFQILVLWLTPEVRPWHATMALGLLAVGLLHQGARVRVALLALVLVELIAVFRTAPVPGAWLDAVWSGRF